MGGASRDGDFDVLDAEKEEAGLHHGESAEPVTVITLDDDEKPINMPRWRKWAITMLTAAMAFTITLCSSGWSSAIEVTAKEFGVGEVVMLLGVSFYVLGFAIGPLLWGPMSEKYGRRLPLFGTFVAFAIFQIPLGLAKNLQTILISRFFAGMFGGAPLVINSAMFADFWAPTDRGIAASIYAASIFGGPTFGPIIGSFLVDSHLGWRWIGWLTLIIAAATGIPSFIVVIETCEPILLEQKAKRLGIRIEVKRGSDDFVKKYLTRPVLMMIYEPMLIIVTVYISLVYGILYLTFFALPYSFTIERKWDPRVGSLSFLAIFVGSLLAVPGVYIYSKKYYHGRLVARGGIVCPEDRLPLMLLGGILLPIGMFWFGWTSSPNVIWVPQALAGIPMGAGISFVFQSGLAYIIDVYLASAASALAANTFVRSLVAAGFPLFAPAMYRKLGTPWATSVLGFLCVALAPAPIVFYFYGERIRKRSRFAAKQ